MNEFPAEAAPCIDAIGRLRAAGHAVEAGDVIKTEREGQIHRIYRNGELLITEPLDDTTRALWKSLQPGRAT